MAFHSHSNVPLFEARPRGSAAVGLPRSPPTIWRLSVLWQGRLLDTVTLKGRKGSLQLRTGEHIKVRVVDPDHGSAHGSPNGSGSGNGSGNGSANGRGLHSGGENGEERLEIVGDGLLVVLVSGQRCTLPAGHVLHAVLDVPVARFSSYVNVDSTLLHSTMISIALQVCAVSAVWLRAFDNPSDVGAGLSVDARRWLSIPGGTAPAPGRPVFAPTGRKPHEAERAQPARKKGSPPLPQRKGKGPSLEQTLEAMKRALHPGDDGDLRESLGHLSQAVAHAPVLGNAAGGLSPRDPVDTGPGSGVIGAGTTLALDDLLRRRVEQADKKALSEKSLPRQVFAVIPADVPDADVDNSTVDTDPDLDPVVRDHLSRMIRARHNVIRSCYESWGLAADAHRRGRLVLELTLLPDGHVEDLQAQTSTLELRRVGDCVLRAASEWYLGDGLVPLPTRVSFPFVLHPRR